MSGAGGLPLLRRINQGAVLATLRGAGALRLGELAERSGLSRPTVSHVLAQLHEEGWVEYLDEHPAGRSGLGRPARLVRFRAGAGYVMGIDIGPHRTSVIIADLDGNPAATVRRSTCGAQDERELLSAVQSAAREGLRLAGVPRNRILSVVAGSPGIIDQQTGAVVLAPGLPGWTALNLTAQLRRSFRCPVQVENDVNLAVLGERWRGTASDARSLVFVLWGERIGAGICVDGRLHRGASNAAGEIGYLTVLPDGDDALPPDGRGPFEEKVGAGAIAELAKNSVRGNGGILDMTLSRTGTIRPAEVFTAAHAGDRVAQDIVEVACGRLARGLAPLLLVVDPEVMVIGGGVSKAGPIVLEAVQRRLRRLTLVTTRLELSTLGDDAVVTGAVRVALTDVEERLLHGAAAP